MGGFGIVNTTGMAAAAALTLTGSSINLTTDAGGANIDANNDLNGFRDGNFSGTITPGAIALAGNILSGTGYSLGIAELGWLEDIYDTGVTDTEFDYLDGVTSAIQTQLNANNMIGAGNGRWIALNFNFDQNGGAECSSQSIRNTGGTDGYWQWQLVGLPATKGSLKLYISDISMGVYDADGNNKVTRFLMRSLTDHSTWNGDIDDNTVQSTIHDTGADYTPGAPIDCSGYIAIYMSILTEVANAGALDIAYIRAFCYYA